MSIFFFFFSICTLNRWKADKERNDGRLKPAVASPSVPVTLYWIRAAHIFSLRHQQWEYTACISVNNTQWGSVALPEHPVSSRGPSLHQMLWSASVLGQKSPSAESLSARAAASLVRRRRTRICSIWEIRRDYAEQGGGERGGRWGEFTSFIAWGEAWAFTVQLVSVFSAVCSFLYSRYKHHKSMKAVEDCCYIPAFINNDREVWGGFWSVMHVMLLWCERDWFSVGGMVEG